MKQSLLPLLLSLLSPVISDAQTRYTQQLSGNDWHLWRDTAAVWQNDRLYLPDEVNLSAMPVNQPTGGWQALDPASAVSVSVPGTVEEYCTTSTAPRPDDLRGVSWWFRTVEIPESERGKRILLDFESVRMRAEVYVDGKLCGYDLVGESPFTVDATELLIPGTPHQLAVRVTNPSGNFHWQDFDADRWGDYQVPPGRGFGGIIGRVNLSAVPDVYIADTYVQNLPDITRGNAVLTISNNGNKKAKRNIGLEIRDKESGKLIWNDTRRGVTLTPGDNEVTVTFDCPDAEVWDLDNPALYTLAVTLADGRREVDSDSRTFGFRWFEPTGIGSDAMLRLNGRRVVPRTAISWGFWPATGLHATEDMAVRQIESAMEYGLNMLNFHRSIGSPIVLEKADSIGLLYYEEPGAFHSADHDPFIRTLVNTKLQRMIKRDRSHPSLVIYNLINEFGGRFAADSALVAKRMVDMAKAHAIDPSRIMTFTSGWASNETAEEDSKSHFRPYDSTLYRRGWWDNHRAGGPATWEDGFYHSPSDNIMATTNRTEINMRGEEGAISTPPRVELIAREVERTGKPGWDGLFWLDQYKSFRDYFDRNNLAPYFGTVDSLTRMMGDVQLYHQGRRIELMRMLDLGDVYAINGWESMPYDNHSGVVDIYRNHKGNTSTLARYNRPLYVAVAPRTQFVKPGSAVTTDFYIVNEIDRKGDYTLNVAVQAPDGSLSAPVLTRKVCLSGGDTFGEPLALEIPVTVTAEGMNRIVASLTAPDGEKIADGWQEVLSVKWDAEALKGNGALYGPADGAVATFYADATGRELPQFDKSMPALDWILISRPALDAPIPVDPSFFSDIKVTFYSDEHTQVPVGSRSDDRMGRTFADGSQPDSSLPANTGFSAMWEGTLRVPETGMYMIGATGNRGIRLDVNGQRVIDDWYSSDENTRFYSFSLKAGEEVPVKLHYRQGNSAGSIGLVWSRPGSAAIAPDEFVHRAAEDGTALIIVDNVPSWMTDVTEAAGIGYDGFYAVGSNWIGGIHFVKEHSLFAGLPVNCAMDWPYQALVKDGDERLGLYLDGGEMVAGSYRSTPFHLGAAAGILPLGKGKVIYSTLDLAGALGSAADGSASATPADVARRMLCNFISFSTKAD
ncbi:MAG: beta-galactosidase [Bacteroides sp.]|nr:beta-galactosidase [Bacteroides sp.]